MNYIEETNKIPCLYDVDVLVIGGGAAGLCSAITIKRKNPSLNVAVIEQLSRVGKKLIVTGNGRCNITNEDILLSSFHSENEGFLSCVLENYNKDMTKDFFESLGVVFTCDDICRAVFIKDRIVRNENITGTFVLVLLSLLE